MKGGGGGSKIPKILPTSYVHAPQDNTTTFYPTPVFMIQQFKMRDDYYNDVNIGRGMSILHADVSETVD